MKSVVRTEGYLADLDDIFTYIAQDNEQAASDLWFYIDDQVTKLADPNFPRRPGRVKNTRELVAHPNYIVILKEDVMTVRVLNVVHARKKYP
ncbi:MAG: hypothetical protein RL748_2143 [Pseudomonadota bacterium]|jgi:plasmid stabilization system protein ParE